VRNSRPAAAAGAGACDARQQQREAKNDQNERRKRQRCSRKDSSLFFTHFSHKVIAQADPDRQKYTHQTLVFQRSTSRSPQPETKWQNDSFTTPEKAAVTHLFLSLSILFPFSHNLMLRLASMSISGDPSH
jgi:hypothetical protein